MGYEGDPWENKRVSKGNAGVGGGEERAWT